MNVNDPKDALAYMLQVASDYASTLPPSTALGLLTMSQHAHRALHPLVHGPQPAADEQVPSPEA